MDKREELLKEVNLKDSECCVVLRLGCYYPYHKAGDLIFSVQIGAEQKNDFQVLHRSGNKNFFSVYKSYGTGEISKIGYPVVLPIGLGEQSFQLTLSIGISGLITRTMIFTISTGMAENQTVCDLTFRYIFNEMDLISPANTFVFESFAPHGFATPNRLSATQGIFRTWKSSASACTFLLPDAESEHQLDIQRFIIPAPTQLAKDDKFITHLYPQKITPVPFSLEHYNYNL